MYIYIYIYICIYVCPPPSQVSQIGLGSKPSVDAIDIIHNYNTYNEHLLIDYTIIIL